MPRSREYLLFHPSHRQDLAAALPRLAAAGIPARSVATPSAVAAGCGQTLRIEKEYAPSLLRFLREEGKDLLLSFKLFYADQESVTPLSPATASPRFSSSASDRVSSDTAALSPGAESPFLSAASPPKEDRVL